MKLLIAVATLVSFIVQTFIAGPASANPAASATTASSASDGTLTEVKGHVFRRGFADERKEVWCEPEPARVGDVVSDGMQVGTGDKSWTQCTWKHVTARAWENSVYMVSPKRKLVYLVGGELLFNLDKHRSDKTPYSVWTKYLHATVRGTTILVQSTPDGSRLSVLEGTVDVTNRLDNSVATLTPGVVYEVKAKENEKKPDKISSVDSVTDGAYIAKASTAAEQLGLRSTIDAFAGKVNLNSATSIVDLAILDLNPVVLFDSLTSTTIAALTSVQQVLLHPLLSSAFESPLLSLPLIKSEMPQLSPNLISHQSACVSEVFKAISVTQVPILTSYSIGSDLLPRMKGKEVSFIHWPPSGVVSWSRNAGGNLPVVGSVTDKLTGKLTEVSSQRGGLGTVLNQGGVVSLSQVSGLGANLVNNVSRQVGITNSATLTGARAGGVVGGVVGGVGGALNGVGGVVGGAVGGINQTVGGVGGAAGGALGGILGSGGLGGLLK